MSVRGGYLIDDIQKSIYSLLDSKTVAPWDRWNVIRGYPSTDIFADFTQPLIYVETPKEIEKVQIMASSKSLRKFRMIVGGWTDRSTGGRQELSIIESQLGYFFDDFKTAHTAQFTVRLGTTTYTNTTVKDLGFEIMDILAFEDRAVEDEKEFRSECMLILLG